MCKHWIAEASSTDQQERRKKSGFLVVEDEQGRVVDFHSLRMTFITNLTKSGVSPKTAQLLARHSDINLTMNTYTTLSVLDQAVAVEALPAVPPGEGTIEEMALPLRSTGTADQDRVPNTTSMVPTMVPRGAGNGAKQLASVAKQMTSNCTKSNFLSPETSGPEVSENPEKKGPIRTRKGQYAPLCIVVPEEGLEPSRPCGHWILNPARLPIPPLRHGFYRNNLR